MDYTRQRDWFDPSRINSDVTVVGCGGIGSFAAFALAKLGVSRLSLLDFDTVDEHNIPNQFYTLEQYGMLKVDALSDTIEQASPCDLSTHNQRLEEGVPLSAVVVSALDSMEARAELWKQVRLKVACNLFLDARLGGEHVVLYAVNPMSMVDIEGYEATLYSDEEASDLPCTGRSIIDVGFLVGSLITRAVRRHYKNDPVDHVTYFNQQTLDVMKGDWLND